MTAEAIPTDWDAAFPAQRRMMVECQVRTFDVTDHGILGAMLEIPRERFVDPRVVPLAYADRSLPSLGGGRQLLAPMVLARMIQYASVRPGEKILELAGGSGYGAAILARLGGVVTTLDADEMSTQAAQEALAAAGASGVSCVTGALPAGHPHAAPYDVILVNGAYEEMPQDVLQQLADRGRLVAIDAGHGAPKAVRFERIGADVSVRPLFDAAAPVLDGFARKPTFQF